MKKKSKKSCLIVPKGIDMIKAIAMDFGGVYFEDGTGIAVEKICGLVKVPKEVVEEVFRNAPKKEGWLYRIGKLTDEEFIEAGMKKLDVGRSTFLEFMELWHSSYAPKKDMERLVSALRKDYKVAIFSQAPKSRFDYINRKYGLPERFDDIILSSEAGFGKEDKELYRILLDRLKCRPEECVFIDDSQKFLDIAKSVGMQAILFKSPEQLKADLKALGAKI